MNSETLNHQFETAIHLISQQSWFKNGNWTIQESNGETWQGLQLSKTNWFNDDGNGIHFETWLSDDVVREGLLRFQAHVMHAGMTFPGTDIKASALSKPVVARHKGLIQSWGFNVQAAPGMTLLAGQVPFTADTLTEVIINQCQQFSLLGDTIDEVLGCLLEGRPVPKAPRKLTKSQEAVNYSNSFLPEWEADGELNPRWSVMAQPKVEVELKLEADGTLRVDVTGKASKNHDAILRCTGLSLRAGKMYQGRYEVKAATPRWMTGNIRQAEAPHLPVGQFKGRDLKEEWQSVSWEFTALRDCDDTELLFALGKVPNTIWFRRIELREAQ